jgi:hypothetical protein
MCENELAKYRADLQKARNGELKAGSLIRVGTTPKIYLKYKLHDASLNLPVNVVKKAVVDKHEVSIAIIENLPKLLELPIAIFKSLTEEKSLVAVVDAQDESKRQVIAILRPVDSGINIIPSLYGKDNFDNFVKKTIDNEKVLFVDKNKAAENFRPQELQLLKEEVFGDLKVLSP